MATFLRNCLSILWNSGLGKGLPDMQTSELGHAEHAVGQWGEMMCPSPFPSPAVTFACSVFVL